MPDLNLDLNYFDHRKIKRLIGLLGKGAAECHLRLLCYCGKYHVDGKLDGYSPQEIEGMAGWDGDAGAMLRAMLSDAIALMDKTKTGYAMHDFLEYQGHIGALKERASHAAKVRWDNYRRQGKCHSDDKHAKAMLNDAPSIARASSKDVNNLHKITDAIALPQASTSNAPSIPSIPTNKQQVSVWFSQIWKRYPRPVGKKQALRHFQASIKTQEDYNRISVALNNYLRTDTVKRGIIQNGSTWFNNWEDYLDQKFGPEPAVGRQNVAENLRQDRMLRGLSPCCGQEVSLEDLPSVTAVFKGKEMTIPASRELICKACKKPVQNWDSPSHMPQQAEKVFDLANGIASSLKGG